MSFDEKKFKHELLEMFSEELQESERDMRNAIDGLRRSLTSDFRNPSELKRNSKHRLDFLRVATMKEEQSYNRLKVSNPTCVREIVRKKLLRNLIHVNSKIT